jgi:hypothetical protein
MSSQPDGARRLLLVYGERGAATLDDLRPALDRLRLALPGAHLTLWTAPELREAAKALSGVGALLDIPRCWLDDVEPAVSAIESGRHDAALIFSEPGNSPYAAAYACYLAGVPVRLGQSAEFGGAVLSLRIIPPSPALPPAAHYLCLVSQVVGSF